MKNTAFHPKAIFGQKDSTLRRTLLCLMLLLMLFVSVVLTALVSNAVTYYTLRIDYLFTDGSKAHDPYVAVLAAGTDVDIEVTNPALPGYKAASSVSPGPDDPAVLTTHLEYNDLHADDTVTIYYVPDLVHYRVHYFKQNIRDDLYTEDTSLGVSYYEKTGYTGDYPEDLEVPFEGFTVLFHEPDFIAADGSTQFKIYYDRDYYLVNFDPNGGHGSEPVYGKYESVYHIAEPTRKGFIFEGWVLSDDNGNFIDEDGNPLTDAQAKAAARKFTSGTVPAKNVRYKAYWTAADAYYTVVYWVENPNTEGKYTDVALKVISTYVDGSSVTTGDTVSLGDPGHPVPDFFSFNLNPQKVYRENGQVVLDNDLRPTYLTNDAGEPIDEAENVIDFPEMSPGEHEELNGKSRYFEVDTEKSTASLEVSGDGSSRFNVYYKRRVITQRFFFARKYVDNSGTEHYEIPGWTKAFSNNPGTLDQHLWREFGPKAPNQTHWMELGTTLPAFSSAHPELEAKQYPAEGMIYDEKDRKNYVYYYYEMKTKYYANMRSTWLTDAFEPYLITNNKSEGDGDSALFGAWSAEWGTPYADQTNKTVKGMYEKLDERLLYTEAYLNDEHHYVDDPLVLNYLSFWANAKNKDWNKKNTFYNFTYKNYVELLPDEYTPDKQHWNGTGGYVEVIEVNYQSADTTMTGSKKLYGLLPENIIETYDGATDYGNSSTRDAKIKQYQTPAALTGFALLTDAEVAKAANWGTVDSANPEAPVTTQSLTQNPICHWYAKNGFDNNHHADIKFLYRRRYYSLVFLNNDQIIDPSLHTRNIYYQMDINSTGIRGNWVYYVPEYTEEGLKPYYYFDGWYFDQDYDEDIPVMTNDPDPPANGRSHFNTDFKMPADDVTLYAKWNLITEPVSFYQNYTALTDGENPLHSCEVEYNSHILTKDVPTTEDDPYSPVLQEPENATFAGWYYLNETGTPVRFDPDSMPVTRELKLYAAWSSDETAEYQIRYVVKGTGTEIAPPTHGTSFVHQTKSFRAKTGSQLYEDYRDQVGENLWRPHAPSHSLTIEQNDPGETYEPNTFTFFYIQKNNVWYQVRYLDAQTGAELTDTKIVSTPNAIISESSVYIQGYIPDSVSKTLVLAASDDPDEAQAKDEELAANTIVFLYTRNDRDVLYRVDHYIEKIDGSGYELHKEETYTAELHSVLNLGEVFQNSPTAQTLITTGFTVQPDLTQINGELAHGETQEVDENQLIISFYYTRNKYAYTVQYVDYKNDTILKETVYNGEDELQPVGKEVTIEPEEHFTYTPPGGDPIGYTRISDRILTLTIHPDDNEQPAVNIIKVYYREDKQRLLRYQVSCLHDTTDHYGDVSFSHQIVENAAEIETVTAILHQTEDHEYVFLGWYDVPKPGDSDTRLTDSFDFKPEFPGADRTYYAVFDQVQVSLTAEIRYNDTGVYDDGAQEDTNGSVTGHVIAFTAPQDYTSGSDTPKDKLHQFALAAAPKDDGVYLYEFAGWYAEDPDTGDVTKDDDHPDKQLTLNMTQSYHYIAMFKKVSAVPYQISFRFTPRLTNALTDPETGRNEFVVKGTLSSDDFDDAIGYDDKGPRLTDDFILTKAPYESNHFQTLKWSDKNISTDSGNGTLYATVIADQQTQKVHLTYRLEPGGATSVIETDIGANRITDPRIAALDVRGKTVDDKYFSYWEIRNDNHQVVAKCYEPLFSFQIWENYTVTPVFNNDAEEDPVTPPDQPKIDLISLDNSRNRWTDSSGNLSANAYSDYLYTDFEVAYQGPDIYNDTSYRAGMVFEVCDKYYEGLDLNSCNYVSDENNLKEAVKNNTSGNSTYVYAHDDNKDYKRVIQVNTISTEDLSTRSRAQYAKAFRNVISATTGAPTNGNYVFKVYAFLIDADQNVTLSNPVYVCMHSEAVRDQAYPELIELTVPDDTP